MRAVHSLQEISNESINQSSQRVIKKREYRPKFKSHQYHWIRKFDGSGYNIISENITSAFLFIFRNLQSLTSLQPFCLSEILLLRAKHDTCSIHAVPSWASETTETLET